jgi:hypothetical protein
MNFSGLVQWLDAVKVLLGIIVIVFPVILFLIRKAAKKQVMYAAKIAELFPKPPEYFAIILPLQEYSPLPSFPVYSELSTRTPNFPPRYFKDRNVTLEKMKSILADAALKQARQWETTLPGIPSLVGADRSDQNVMLYQTWTRLRWYLFEECDSSYSSLSHKIGPECAVALQTLEDIRNHLLEHLPTRVLIIKVENRGRNDAKDVTVDITSGGEIYDVVVNDQLPDARIDRSENRFMIKWPTTQSEYAIEIKLWYKWKAVLFGSRMGSQSEIFPGFEGVIINHIGVENAKVRRWPRLLADLGAWNSIDVRVGPQIRVR